MPENTYLAFLRSPDQAQREAELTAYFGPHADVFLKVYAAMREDAQLTAAGGRRKWRLGGYGFEAAAFFLGPVWFFYRKMWSVAWLITGLLVVLSFLPIVARLGVVVAIIMGRIGRQTYVQYAIGKLNKLRATDSSVSMEAVRIAGGVSRPAGIISGVIFGLLWVLAIISIVYLARHGVDPA